MTYFDLLNQNGVLQIIESRIVPDEAILNSLRTTSKQAFYRQIIPWSIECEINLNLNRSIGMKYLS